MFAVLACFAFMIVEPQNHVNPLLSVLNVVGNTDGLFSRSVLFIVVLGLYGAMLSTASTQLIAVSHTLYEDVFSRIRKHSLSERLDSKAELSISRAILIIAAVMSTILVQLLSVAGFSIADLVFAIYGAQLGLCPLVISALFLSRQRLKKLSVWATLAVSAGFVTGWGVAVYGRLSANTNLVFLAPVSSLVVSTALICLGFLAAKRKALQS
jgi:Na+/proline symporter